MKARPGLIRVLPFALYIILLALDPLLRELLPSGLDGRWFYGARAGVALTALLLLWPHYAELKDISTVRFREWGLSVAAGVLVLVLWVNLDVSPLALAPGEGFDPRMGGQLHPGLVAVRLAGAVLVVPIMEELFWRSFILRWIQNSAFLSVDPAGVSTRAIFISSALFATEHRLWFAGLLAGLVYGWLYKRTGNLWVPILSHAVTNGLLGLYVLTTETWVLW